MAGGMDLGAGLKGRKRALDTTINLVPFIDLMAVTISFLIMTAVWTQIGRLQVSQSGSASAANPVTQIPILLVITPEALRLSLGDSPPEPLPIVRDSRGSLELSTLRGRLETIAAQFPDQKLVTLQTDDSVRYEDLVRIIDECVGDGFAYVSVATG